jgi:hypothetical protein
MFEEKVRLTREYKQDKSRPFIEICVKLNSQGLQECDLRAEWPVVRGAGEIIYFTGAEVVCRAAGGHRLAIAGEDLTYAKKLCNACDVPSVLASPIACLYLIPFRIISGDKVKSYYACRPYFNLAPKTVPSDPWWCGVCRDWFPRPPRSSEIMRYDDYTRKVIQLFLGQDDGSEKLAIARVWKTQESLSTRKKWWAKPWDIIRDKFFRKKKNTDYE